MCALPIWIAQQVADLQRVARGIGEIGGDVGRRRLREIAVDVLCQPRRDAESLLGASDGLVEQLVPAQRAVVALRGREHRDRARDAGGARSEEHTSELQSLMRISYAVFCLKKKNY